MASPGVQSVDRALDLLEALGSAERSLSLAEAAQRTSLTPPTAHRLLRTMQARGYVNQNASREYSPGPALIALGRRATPALAVLAQPVLAELEEISGETANLAVLDQDLIAYVAQVPSRHRMRMFTEVGRQVLPHASGVGKAILSTLPEAKVRAILQRTGMPGYTPSTITDELAFFAELRESRRRGFAIDDGEQEVGVRCIAVALPAHSSGAELGAAAVSISGPAARVTEAESARYVEALQNAAARLADARGSLDG